MMSGYNRNNPIVIMMEDTSKEVEHLAMDYIKTNIILLISWVAISLFFILINNLNQINFLPVVVFLMYLIVSQYEAHKVNNLYGTLSKARQVIYGDEYKDILVNNEKMFILTYQLYEIRGTIKAAKRNIIIIFLLSSVFYLILSIGGIL